MRVLAFAAAVQAILVINATARSAAPTDVNTGNTLLSCNFGDNMGRSMHFADLMKQALPFGQPDLPASQNASVDAAGWPTQPDFSVSVYSEGVTKEGYSWPPARIDGVYTITARGSATMRFPVGGETIGTILNQSYDATTNLFVAYVSVPNDPALNGGRLEFTFTGTTRNPSQPSLGAGMTNISVLQPGYPIGTDPDTFTPEGIATYAPCKGAIRVMPWWLAESASVSTVTSGSWAKRVHVGVPSYLLGEYGTFGPGVPWEVLVAYVNALGASIWANVPPGTINELNVTARDEYTFNLITLLNAALPPGKVIYLEFGNELWNGSFEGNWVVSAIANSSVLNDGDPYQLNYNLATPPDVKNLQVWSSRYVAWMAKHMGDIASTVVGGDRVGRADLPGVRVVPILGVQGGYPSSAIGQIEYLINVWDMPAFVGTIATDGYTDFGADGNYTGDEIIALFEEKIASISPAAGQPAPSWCNTPWSTWATVGAYYGFFLHAYEGSPIHTGQLSMEGLSDAYADPRFAGLVSGTIGVWQAWHGGAYNWFTGGAETTYCPWGSNAVTWDMRETDTPKMAGIVSVVASPPVPVTGGLPLPVNNHYWNWYVGHDSGGNCSVLPVPSTYPTSLNVNQSVSYLLYVPDPTTCRLKVSVSMCNRGKTAGANFMRFSIASWLAPIDFPTPAGVGGCAPEAYVNVERTFPAISGPRFTGNPQITLVFTNAAQPAGSPGYMATSFNVSCA